MGVFAENFGYTPAEYRALTWRDRRHLIEHLKERAARTRPGPRGRPI